MFEFHCKPFSDLSSSVIYGILKLRSEVFVVEQNCIYLDCDNKDLDSLQSWIQNQEGQIIATARILPKGVSYADYISIGRVATHFDLRRTGVGKLLMHHVLEMCKLHFPGELIKISAQSYLLDFYARFGFSKTGEEYLEDNIPHCAMVMIN